MAADDEEFLTELKSTVAMVDPVPEEVVSAATAALAMRRTATVLAELDTDSAISPPAGLRDSSSFGVDPRFLTFRTGDVTVQLEVTSRNEGREIVGQLFPAQSAPVEIRWPDGSNAQTSDATGHFVAREIPSGPVSVLCRLNAAAPVATSWLSI